MHVIALPRLSSRYRIGALCRADPYASAELVHALDLKPPGSFLLFRSTYPLRALPKTLRREMSNVGKKHTTVANPDYEPQAYSKSGYSTFKAF